MKKLLILVSLAMSFVLYSCDRDDEYTSSSKSKTSTKNKISKPTITVSIATTTKTSFEVVFKVESKDEEENDVVLHYGTNESCSKSSTCRLYRGGRLARYYKATHTGFSGGTKIGSVAKY